MYTIRLFHKDDPFTTLDVRQLARGELSLGRDFESDWVIADSNRSVSRRHCVFSAEDGKLTVRDVSANGIFRDPDRARLPLNQDVASSPGDVFRFGQFIIAIDKDEAQAGEEAPPFPAKPVAANDQTCGFSLSAGLRSNQTPVAVNVPSEWSEGEIVTNDRPLATGEYGLLEAFCAGAGLDPSSFATEDSHDVMRRAGAFYRQSVLGLADLMGERSAMKVDYALERTTIGSAGNNPIKWAAPQRLAVDLLCDGDGQFLKDAAAANEAFTDIKRHIICLTTAMRVVLDECLLDLAPGAIKAASSESGLSFKRAGERYWAEFERRFHIITDGGENHTSPRVRAAYEQHMAVLNRAGER